MYMDRAEKMVDADFAKKIETDALTKALSKIGFNADVFMGLYDDHKYVAMIQEEFKEKDHPTANDEGWIRAGKDNKSALDQITDPVYRLRIELFIKEGY